MLKGRLEDERMLTGRGKYVSDWNLPNQAYGVFLRSDRAHADIVALDAAAALAHRRLRFTGEPVALVIAESAVAAADAAELINVEYRDRPAVVSAANAVQSGAPLVHDSVPGNVVMDYESGDDAASKAAFAKAARTMELEVDISRVVGNPMEPRACLAHWHSASEQYHLYTYTQAAPIMRNQLSAVLGVPP